MDSKLIDSLKFIGFSEYEAKVYVALVQLGGGTATEISKVSQVPTNRVYQTLDRLQDKGYVKGQIGDGIANFYMPEDPEHVINNIESQYKKHLENAKMRLSAIWERAKRIEFPTMWTLRGNRSVYGAIKEYLENSEEFFYLTTDTLFDLKEYELLNPVIEKKNNGVDVRIITSSTGVDDPGEIEILNELTEVPVKIVQNLNAIWCINEKNQVLFGGFGIVNERGEKDFVCLQSDNEGFANSVRQLFIATWQYAETVKKE